MLNCEKKTLLFPVVFCMTKHLVLQQRENGISRTFPETQRVLSDILSKTWRKLID